MQGESAAAEEFLQAMAEKANDFQEEIMTIAQQLEAKGIQKGMQKGMQAGMQKGIQLGRQETRYEIARQLLASGIERPVVILSTGLSDEEVEALIITQEQCSS